VYYIPAGVAQTIMYSMQNGNKGCNKRKNNEKNADSTQAYIHIYLFTNYLYCINKSKQRTA